MRLLLLLALAAAALLARPAVAEAPPTRITAWPLVYHVSGETEAETDILWPFLRYERKDTYTRYALRPFLFSTERDPARDYRETSVLWPLSLSRHEPGKDWFHLFPVYWDYTGPEQSWWHLWPLYGTYHRGQSYTEHSTIWPLFSYGTDSVSGDVDWDAPWPLIGYERSGERIRHRLLPLYQYTGEPDASSGFVLPYFWSLAPGRTTRGVFPLWYSHDTPDHDTQLVLPFYFRDEVPDRALTFITPFWMDRQAPDSRLRALIPFYMDYDGPTFGIELGLPLYGHFGTPDSTYTTVLPVYFHSRDRVRDSEFTYYFPFYGSYRRGDAVSRHYLLFPLYSKLEDHELELVAWDVLWPLFHYETSPDSLDARALPFYWRSRNPTRDWTFAMLLYGSMQSADVERRWLVPFYFHQRDQDSSITQALLYYRAQRADTSTTLLVPLWYHRSAPERVVDASPVLHWYEREAERRRWAFLWLMPPDTALVRYGSGPGYRSHGLFPLYGYERDEARDRVAWSALWPVFSYSAEGEVARESGFLWKVFTYERTDAHTREYRLLWRFVRSREAPGQSLFEFNPFYYYEREEGKGDYWNILGGLIGRRTAEDGTTDMQWLWFF